MLGGVSIASIAILQFAYSKQLWLAVDEVVHHYNVMLPIVVRTGSHVAGFDADRGDAGVIECDAEEREVPVARRCGNDTAEDKCAVPVEVLDPRACRCFHRRQRHLAGQHL